MRNLVGFLLVLFAFCTPAAYSWPVRFHDITIDLPEGWTVHQTAKSDQTHIIGFNNKTKYIRIYARPQNQTFTLRQMLVNGSDVLSESNQSYNYDFKVMETKKGNNHVAGFQFEKDGYTYYGYTKETNRQESKTTLDQFLSRMR
jgi:hypothetical protein